jgi:hypothetical protein
MTKISIRCSFNIRQITATDWHANIASGPATFVLGSTAGAPSTVTIDFPNKRVEVLLPEFEVEDELVSCLQNADKLYANAYPAELAGTIEAIKQAMQYRARRVVEHAKYFLGLDHIADDVITDWHEPMWSSNSGAFQRFPGLIGGAMGFRHSMPLNDETRSALQEGLDKDFRPFLAMRHLYRAMQESSPRFKWIDATIAAELAIKEFLARKQPDLEVLLVHLPSPPLLRLYREVLEKHAGEKSPYWKELDNGSQKRNKLVHQHEAIVVTEAEAIEYASVVMKAIHHLYALLYPDWVISANLKDFDRVGM